MKAKPKACIATDWLYLGGALSVTKFVYATLKHGGYDPVMLFPRNLGIREVISRVMLRRLELGEESHFGMDAVGVDSIEYIDFLRYLLPARTVARELSKYDLFIVSGGGSLSGLPLALNGKPYICWAGTLMKDELSWDGQKRPWPGTWRSKTIRLINEVTLPLVLWEDAHVFRKAAKVLVQSSYTADRLISDLHIPAGKVEVLPMAVDTGIFKPAAPGGVRPVEGRYVLAVGRLNDSRKNVPLLLRAFSLVRQRAADVKLVLVGRVPRDESLERMCGQLGIADAVLFAGQVDAHELESFYQNAELFILSSYQEGFGIVLIEAMACGLPAVSTRCGGPQDVIENGENGFLVPVGDASALADAVCDLLTNNLRRLEMGLRARETVSRRFACDVVERRLLEICGQVA